MKYKLSNYNEIDEIIASFKKNKINLIKYGNNFTSIHTSGQISQGCLKLSPDGKQFQVYLKKFRNQQPPITKYSTSYGTYKEYQELIRLQKQREKDFEWKLSQCSFKINEIEGFIFGGFSSRFWSFRKQMNLIDMTIDTEETRKQIPFYPWECITIQCKCRDLDLVIKNQKDMQNLLKFLYYKRNLIDKDTSLIKNIAKTNHKQMC